MPHCSARESQKTRPTTGWYRGAALMMLLSLSACVMAQTTTGPGIPPEDIAKIKVGQSTRSDVTRVLGPPDEIIYSQRAHDPLFEQAYRYQRIKSRQSALFLIIFSTFRRDEKWDHVITFFDEAGTVQHVGVCLDQDSAKYGMPF